jgi:hypothetical protein
MKRVSVRRGLDALPWAALVLAVGCNVPRLQGSTGGIEGGAAGNDASAEAGASDCGRGFVVLESQYESTNVALLDLRGRVLTESLISSASGNSDLSAPIGGDVVTATGVATGAFLPLIDRGTPRIDWVELSSGKLASTLAVDTGFPSFPQDYATVSAHKGYVSRLGNNRAAGQQDFDQGSDLLVVDPSRLSITGSVDLRPALGADSAKNLPRPANVVIQGKRAFVLLENLGADTYTPSTASRLAVVDTDSDTLQGSLLLDGLQNCAGLAVSPGGRKIAVFCSALVDPSGASNVASSGIGIVDVSADPSLEQVVTADVLGPRPVGFYGDFATESVLLVTTFGAFDDLNQPTAQDALLRVDLAKSRTDTVLESGGTPFTLGGVACAAACGVCLVADASRNGGVVHRYTVSAEGAVSDASTIKVETRIGLPPRYIGRF